MNTSNSDLIYFRDAINAYLKNIGNQATPSSLYEPIRYVLHESGKRIRPVSTMITGRMAGAEDHQILPIAAAVEVFHNFTLVHDDIMDHADERRGRLTVHKKWDESVAILSGDMMVGMAYRLIFESKTDFLRDILTVFSDGVDAVCEGQALDKEFEVRQDVTIEDYIDMIDKKTGWLIATALQLGYSTICGNDETAKRLHQLGMLLGRGFQLQDDFLDLMGDQASFGKRIGGDIVEGKKTYLLLKARELAKGLDSETVVQVINRQVGFERVDEIRSLFESLGVIEATRTKIESTFKEMTDVLESFSGMPAYDLLIAHVESVLKRKF